MPNNFLWDKLMPQTKNNVKDIVLSTLIDKDRNIRRAAANVTIYINLECRSNLLHRSTKRRMARYRLEDHRQHKQLRLVNKIGLHSYPWLHLLKAQIKR